MIFQGYSSAAGYEPWISNGTTTGTSLLIDLYPGTNGSYPLGFYVISGKIYFEAQASSGYELYVTDGTAANTQLVKDINPGPGGSYPSSFVGMNGVLYFRPTTARTAMSCGARTARTP